MFRIQGDAIAALHNGEEQRIDLDGCSIGGSAYGDLSSERVYVRTQNMTCARDPKTVIERNVKAYIAGSAKAGVRGEVVSREGDFITTALLAGVVSGFGRGLSQSSSGSLGGITIQQGTQERSTGDVFQQGLGEGLSTSSDRISNYLIRRAEQYQPVIMLQAGRDDVEIVLWRVSTFPTTTRHRQKRKKRSPLATQCRMLAIPISSPHIRRGSHYA